jgi:translation initiation factor 1
MGSCSFYTKIVKKINCEGVTLHVRFTDPLLSYVYTSFNMNPSDWKDALSNLKPAESATNQHPDSTPVSQTADSRIQKNPLVIRFEKRNGKPTTIVSRFEGNAEALLQLASELKKQCSAGGSAKDDEILIQGDVRDKVVTFLTKKGFSIKGDTKKITGNR